MKTFKLTLLVCTLWIMHSCTQDSVVNDLSSSVKEEIVTWKSQDGLRKFLPAEFLDQYDQTELSKIESIIRDEKQIESRRNEIHLAANTTNKLTAGIAGANDGDVIVLDPGDHFETGTVLVNKSITIIGYSANLIFSNTPGFTDATAPLWSFTPGIHINKAGCGATIRGITFKGADSIPGNAIFFERTQGVKILSNVFENWQESIVGYDSKYCTIWKNKINAHPGWATGVIPESDGIILSDGSHNQLIENEINNAFFGIFTGGSQGIDFSNKTNNCFAGQILCKVPAGFYEFGGVIVGTLASTNKWLAMFNSSTNNVYFGYLVIDGANGNVLQNNAASNNGLYDIELTGDSYRFGFFTPKSFNNRVHAYSNLKVKNCGENNHVIGGMLVDNTIDPCF